MSEQDEDVAVDTSTEVEEATSSNESSEKDNTVDLAEVENLRKAKSQLTARAKKAEEDLKKFKESHTEVPIKNDPQLSDELKLIARGLSDEEIDKAKVIARGLGIALPEAIKDPLFLSYQATLKEQARKEKAKLGASKGSGESQDSTLIKQDMTRAEHMEAFKKVMGQ